MVRRIDSDNGPRLYAIPDGEDGERLVPSVTTVLGMKAKPQLVAWAAKVERQMVVDASADLYEDLPAVGKKMSRMAYVETLTKRIPMVKAHQLETEKAFETGRLAHEMVEHELRKRMGQIPGEMPRLSAEAALAFAAWEEWASQTHLTPHYIEQMLYSKEWGYAGTCDVVAEIEVDGKLVLAVGDWKTSKGTPGKGPALYDEHGLQVGAYANALLEMGHCKTMPHGFVASFSKTPCDVPFNSRIWTPDELSENLRVFLCLLQVWHWHQAVEAAKPKRQKKEKAS